jgi:hypothetical protein
LVEPARTNAKALLEHARSIKVQIGNSEDAFLRNTHKDLVRYVPESFQMKVSSVTFSVVKAMRGTEFTGWKAGS